MKAAALVLGILGGLFSVILAGMWISDINSEDGEKVFAMLEEIEKKPEDQRSLVGYRDPP